MYGYVNCTLLVSCPTAAIKSCLLSNGQLHRSAHKFLPNLTLSENDDIVNEGSQNRADPGE